MRQRTWPRATALLLTAGLSLTACGSDSGSGDIKGTHKDPTPSQSSAGGDRPKFETPGFTMQFDGWTDSDPTKQAILNDGKERERSLHSALLQDKELDSLKFHSKGAGLYMGKHWVTQFRDENQTLTGKSRYYDPEVKLDGKKSAELKYCNDTSKGFTKDLKTKKVDRQPASADDYILYEHKLELNKQGVWQTVDTTEKPGGCKP